MTKSPPLVSVIITAYNNAPYISDAIKSILNQTLQNLEVVIVDDCSTDNTKELVEKLAKNDSRIRYERLKKNSGAAGKPRNVGIDLSIGKYIFFLDGDDELDRHALKNLYFAAERDICDFVMGETVRLNLVSKKEQRWLPYLFTEEDKNTSLIKRPELLNDPLITNKLYRADFIKENKLYFEEGIHFEDVIYAALVMTHAKSITIIPDDIYIWKVYDIDVRKSISHQRDSIKSVKDRFYAIEQRNKIYASLRNSEINKLCHVQFIKNGAMLHLMDTADYVDTHTDEVIKLLKPIIETIPNECFDELEGYERVIYAMLLLEDKVGLRELAYYRKYKKRLAGKFVEENRRVYWISSVAKSVSKNTSIRRLQDVTDFYIQQTPVSECTYLHEVTSINRKRGLIEIKGVSQDPLGKYNFSEGVEACFVIAKRDQNVRYIFPIIIQASSSKNLRWQVRVEDFNFSLKFGYQPWDGYIELRQGDFINKSPVYIKADDKRGMHGLIIYSLTPLRRVIGCGLQAYRTLSGNLAFRHIEGSGRRRVMGIYKRMVRLSTKFDNLFRRIARRLIEKYAYRLARKLPLNKKLVFFESQLGQVSTGSPKALYDMMVQDPRFIDYTFVWSTNTSDSLKAQRTRCIKRDSWRYFWALSRASILIDDQTLPYYFVKRKGQLYIETWHGIPFKKMGLDEPKIQRSARLSRNIVERAKAWDALVAPSQYFIDTFVNAFRYKGQLITHGTPRNDRLVNKANISKIKRRLDLPRDRKIILYTPTFREASRRVDGKFELPFSLHEWCDQLGKDTYLLIRTHYLNKVTISKSFAPYCMDVSDYPELNDLYLAADCMITDYSSTMFDYATLKRPMIFYTYDYADYTQSERGSYFDLIEDAPGPVIMNEKDLYGAVRQSLKQKDIPAKYKKFLKDYCGDEDGDASRRVIEFIAEKVGL